LHLAAELPKRLLELLGILDDDSHNRKGYLKPDHAPLPGPLPLVGEGEFGLGEAVRVQRGEE
jgi:hypothetical protein